MKERQLICINENQFLMLTSFEETALNIYQLYTF